MRIAVSLLIIGTGNAGIIAAGLWAAGGVGEDRDGAAIVRLAGKHSPKNKHRNENPIHCFRLLIKTLPFFAMKANRRRFVENPLLPAGTN